METILTHEQFKHEALSDSAVKNEYDAFEQEFEWITELIKYRSVQSGDR